ncbi:hypothetical protein P7228_09985 [Altererythrobacter arenosus]|uniref:Maleate isomerase n=1 Tax=Altererythrobacter arenosus TaxID=3032592 RepID=A0ABY8FNG7_9SPHN|nr:hypothetical protein [Altererythrobacter sp. CAU 1644]WFL76327.1 hypothetical protein P7228_09985 [Altererythrobacter sp. CAU 1644]
MHAPIALMTPMANPTVEREMRLLLPSESDYVVGRLVSDVEDSRERLVRYAEELGQSLTQFGGMPLSAVAFACTASSYLIGIERERDLAGQLDVPVLWAAAVIRDELVRRDVGRVAVISPYPEPIHRAGLAYWSSSGFEIAFDARVEIGSNDTRRIYDLAGSEAEGAIARAREIGPDAILLSGTGMPTLALLDPQGSPPIISSNHCLAQAMMRSQGINP